MTTTSFDEDRTGGQMPTGTIDFADSGGPHLQHRDCEQGQAGFTTNSLKDGTHPIRAVCLGDVHFLTSISQIVRITISTGPWRPDDPWIRSLFADPKGAAFRPGSWVIVVF